MAEGRLVVPAVPPAAARALWVAGLSVAFLLLALPLRASIAGDPLLRLRQLDPELAPLRVDVTCGQPLGALGTRAEGLAFHDVARAGACREAAQRRVALAVAAGGLLVVAGLVARQSSPASGGGGRSDRSPADRAAVA